MTLTPTRFGLHPPTLQERMQASAGPTLLEYAAQQTSLISADDKHSELPVCRLFFPTDINNRQQEKKYKNNFFGIYKS